MIELLKPTKTHVKGEYGKHGYECDYKYEPKDKEIEKIIIKKLENKTPIEYERFKYFICDYFISSSEEIVENMMNRHKQYQTCLSGERSYYKVEYKDFYFYFGVKWLI